MTADRDPRTEEGSMFRKEGSRIVAALALALLLVGPVAPAHAAGRPATATHHWPGLANLWTWMRAALPWGPVVQTACDKGSSIDPDGGCHT
jgi:hypothetical protein